MRRALLGAAVVALVVLVIDGALNGVHVLIPSFGRMAPPNQVRSAGGCVPFASAGRPDLIRPWASDRRDEDMNSVRVLLGRNDECDDCGAGFAGRAAPALRLRVVLRRLITWM